MRPLSSVTSECLQWLAQSLTPSGRRHNLCEMKRGLYDAHLLAALIYHYILARVLFFTPSYFNFNVKFSIYITVMSLCMYIPKKKTPSKQNYFCFYYIMYTRKIDMVLFVRTYKSTGYYLSACAKQRGTICPSMQKWRCTISPGYYLSVTLFITLLHLRYL